MHSFKEVQKTKKQNNKFDYYDGSENEGKGRGSKKYQVQKNRKQKFHQRNANYDY